MALFDTVQYAKNMSKY